MHTLIYISMYDMCRCRVTQADRPVCLSQPDNYIL